MRYGGSIPSPSRSRQEHARACSGRSCAPLRLNRVPHHQAAAQSCDYCGGAAAAVYCRVDSARLCLPCDHLVHGANGVCSCHARAPLCTDCRATGAVFCRASSAAAFLCSNCDFGRHRDGL
ncbi:hypothetical protein U9M48_029022, partial [Paspalum notatum var. saurae]